MTAGSIAVRAEAPLAIPAAQADLPAWLRGMTGSDYQGCAFGHIALGHDPDGRGMVNVEWIGGALIVHRYRLLAAKPAEVLLESARSLVLVMNIIPLWVRVRWRLHIQAVPCRLACDVELRAHPLVRLLAEMMLMRWTLRRHVRAEVQGFARLLERAIGRQASARAAADDRVRGHRPP